MLNEEDEVVWKEYTKTVKPLKKKKAGGFVCFFSPKRWFVRKNNIELPNTLDLHKMTLDEAFNVFSRFLNAHFNQKTKKIMVITGRGKDNNGKLKKEFPFWLEHTEIKDKIISFNMKNEGSFEIELRKKC